MRSLKPSLALGLLSLCLLILPAAASAANTSPPSIAGEPTVGSTLTATPGTWGLGEFAYSSWADCPTATFDEDDCSQIFWRYESTQRTLVLRPEHVGHYVLYVESRPDEALVSSNAIGPIGDPEHPFGLDWDMSPGAWQMTGSESEFGLSAVREDVANLSLVCVLDEVQLDEADCDSDPVFTGLADGHHTLSITATLGDQSETISHEWVIGNPTSEFDETPGKLSDEDYAEFSWYMFGPFDSVQVHCSLDGNEAWDDCAPSDTYAELEDLSEGQHTFRIRAFDSEDGSAPYVYQDPVTSYTWTVDTIDPKVSANLPDVIGTDSFNVEFTTNEPLDALECSIDEEPVQDCRFGLQLSGLANGEHEFRFDAYDLAGNREGDYISFYVDAGAPIAIFTQKPPHFTNDPNPTIAWTSATPGASFECRLNEPFWRPCTSPENLSGLGGLEDGDSYEFMVRATKDGRTQSVPSVAHFHVTDRPFDLEWDRTPERLTPDTYADFEVYADEGDTDDLELTCSLDGSAFEVCDSDTSFSDLELGEHTFTVRATDGDSTEELSYTWKVVDGSEMDLAWNYKSDGTVSSTDGSFAWYYSGTIDRIECSLDGAAWEQCSESDALANGKQVTGLSEGPHTFSVRPVAADDTPGAEITANWTVDTIAPTLTLNGPPNPTLTTLPAVLDISSSEPIAFAICMFSDEDPISIGEPIITSVDPSGTWFPCSIDKLASYIPNGARQVQIRAYDAAYNESEVLVVDFTVNVQPPAPEAPKPAPEARKSTVTTPAAQSKKRLKVDWSCASSKCQIVASIKVGKHVKKLPAKNLRFGAGHAGWTINKKLKRWLRAHGKRGQKATLTVTILDGATGATTVTTFRI